MNRAFLSGLALTLAATPALADDTCDTAEEIARTAMEARQVGVPLADMVRAADGNPLLIEISKEAYRHPQYRTDSYQKQVINEFASEVYLLCLEDD